jgi:hypothetical protein
MMIMIEITDRSRRFQIYPFFNGPTPYIRIRESQKTGASGSLVSVIKPVWFQAILFTGQPGSFRGFVIGS